MIEWKTTDLGSVCENVSDTFDFSNHESAIFINTGDVLEGNFLHNNYMNVQLLPGQAKKRIRINDILFSEIRPANKRYAFVKNIDTSDYVVSTKFMIIRAFDCIHPEYLYLFLTSNKNLRDFQKIAESRSGTFPQITFDSVSKLNFSLPLISEQKSIASILSSLDYKIENLRQQNKTLEKIAQTLFKHWFVDFEFPNEQGKPYKGSGGKMINSELGSIPEVWLVSKVGKEIETLGGGTPSTKEESFWKNGSISWYSPTDLTKSAFIFSKNTEKKITLQGLSKSSTKLFAAYSVLLTSRATIGEISINLETACTNQGFITLIPNSYYNVFFLYEWVKSQIRMIKQLASGSTFPELSKSDFRNFDLIKPDDSVMNEYFEFTNTFFKSIENNENQIQNLTKTRDTLLPKLMSGEIRINPEVS